MKKMRKIMVLEMEQRKSCEEVLDAESGKLATEAGKLKEANIKVSCFASKLGDWSRKISGDFAEDIKDLRRAIPRMKEMGTEFIMSMSWPNDGRRSERIIKKL